MHPRAVQTDAAVGVEPIPIDAERLAFDGDTSQDDEARLGDGVPRLGRRRYDRQFGMLFDTSNAISDRASSV